MKSTMPTRFVLFSIVLITLASCQKVITLDLKSVPPQYVINAELYEGTNDIKVRITKTSNYFDASAEPAVTNAVVTLWQNNTNPQVLINLVNGNYVLPNYFAANNVEYKIKVEVDGNTFNATAFMPKHAAIDSLTVSKQIGGGRGGGTTERFIVTCDLKDEAGVRNYYRVLTSANSDSIDYSRFTLFDDKVADGQEIKNNIRGRFQAGDTAHVILLSMDAKVYNFLSTMQTIVETDRNNVAAPSNPNTNFDNNALGYFGVYTIDKKTVLVQ